MLKIDLHLHTSASDGTDEPGALVKTLARDGYDVVAITDHDTMGGVDQAVAAGYRYGVRVIPGIELSTGSRTEIHVLGYGLKQSPELNNSLRAMQLQRGERMKQMIEKLNELGLKMTYEEVLAKADGAVGRAHLARLMVEKGYAQTVKDAFNRYIATGKAGYVPRQRLAVSEGIKLITEHGGLPVIAHPGRIQMDPSSLPSCLRRWREKGLMGIEAYHPSHTDYQCIRFTRLASQIGLFVTGGSDYHGTTKMVPPGAGLDRWITMERDFYLFLRQIDASK